MTAPKPSPTTPNSRKSSQRHIGFFEFFFGLVKFLLTVGPTFVRYKDKLFYDASPKKDSIGRYLEKNAELYSDRPALIFEEKTWSFKEYNEEVNRLANFLISLGIKKGDIFVVFMENRPEMLFCLGAAAKIGASASMINFRLRGKALHHCITIAPCKAVIVGEEVVDIFEGIKADLSLADETPLLLMTDIRQNPIPEGYYDLKKIMATVSMENPPTTADITTHDSFAYVFTSGTTGMPKAAYQYHRSWIRAGHFVGKGMLKITSRDRFYVCLPFFHTNLTKLAWSIAHVCGAAIVMTRKFSASRFWDDVRKYQATAFNYVGELCTYLVNQPESDNDTNHSITRMVGNGLRPDIFSSFKNRFNVNKVIELYGASESDVTFINAFGLEGTIGFNIASKFVLAQYDIDNDELVRDDNGFLIKAKKGEPGILLGEAKKSIEITGYTSKEATEKKMIYDAFEKGDRWFNTGDMLRNIGFGHHEFVDRMGDTFRWKGENVSTMEIEKVANSFPQVEQSTAYGIKFGDGDGRIGMLALLPKVTLESFDFEQFGRLLVSSLPAYAVPRFLRITAEFELTPTLKIKKNPLRDEGYDLEKINDALFVILPDDKKYQPLTPQLYQEINGGKYRF